MQTLFETDKKKMYYQERVKVESKEERRRVKKDMVEMKNREVEERRKPSNIKEKKRP